MKKKNPTNSLVSGGVLQEIKSCRPLRLFITKQRKKGNESNPLVLRGKFLQLSTEKQVKYFQKAIDKYMELLDDKDISEQVQIEGHLFENVLSKREQQIYFQSIDAPTKPRNTTAAYYVEIQKQKNPTNPKPWKSLSSDEKTFYTQTLKDLKAEYAAQIQTFAENLPERLKAEYLAFVNETQPQSHANEDQDENTNPPPITQRRKSVQSIPESLKTYTSEHPQKLTRTQLEDLHKCKPNVLYYERKVPDEEKLTFVNTTAKNTYIRTLFNQLSEKKRHKFILKSTKKWGEYLELNPQVTENQIPTLHLLLGKLDDIHFYFSSLGLPSRPPISANILYNNEKQQTNSQQNWMDLSQISKDEYIKRLAKLKNEYHQKFVEFVEKTLPSDYLRLEFFRNVKYAAKDYESFTKDRANQQDERQFKITKYLIPKVKGDNDVNEFDRIKQKLLATQLNNEQKKLVERLGQLMNKYIEETAASMKTSSNSKTSTGATKSTTTNLGSSKRKSTDSADVVTLNGEISSDNVEHSQEIGRKKKKKHKRAGNETEEASTVKTNDNNNNKDKQDRSSLSSTKKRK